MIFNNYATMAHIRSLRNEPFTPERILELHRMLTADTLDDPADAGRLRHSDDVRVVDNRTGTVLHEPPHWEACPPALSACAPSPMPTSTQNPSSIRWCGRSCCTS